MVVGHVVVVCHVGIADDGQRNRHGVGHVVKRLFEPVRLERVGERRGDSCEVACHSTTSLRRGARSCSTSGSSRASSRSSEPVSGEPAMPNGEFFRLNMREACRSVACFTFLGVAGQPHVAVTSTLFGFVRSHVVSRAYISSYGSPFAGPLTGSA